MPQWLCKRQLPCLILNANRLLESRTNNWLDESSSIAQSEKIKDKCYLAIRLGRQTSGQYARGLTRFNNNPNNQDQHRYQSPIQKQNTRNKKRRIKFCTLNIYGQSICISYYFYFSHFSILNSLQFQSSSTDSFPFWKKIVNKILNSICRFCIRDFVLIILESFSYWKKFLSLFRCPFSNLIILKNQQTKSNPNQLYNSYLVSVFLRKLPAYLPSLFEDIKVQLAALLDTFINISRKSNVREVVGSWRTSKKEDNFGWSQIANIQNLEGERVSRFGRGKELQNGNNSIFFSAFALEIGKEREALQWRRKKNPQALIF